MAVLKKVRPMNGKDERDIKRRMGALLDLRREILRNPNAEIMMQGGRVVHVSVAVG